MYLQALKLNGFKSFADPTTLRFEPGVTAVVGPNGCGKSNIADAIRWVLGEQSAKALRGGKMQDVIFEGVDTRKQAQLCEVSLLLTECEKQLGSEFHEIEIMRRVHRDGQSDYFFNGQPCRLKDIHKLFMDTGIGRTSYSIMAQGQIDQILSSKPEERRAVFEEAAGITKYKSARREAMNKLALTEQNLARVADVIGEVGRQIGSLRRQAAKAVRYKRLNHRFRNLSLAWTAINHAQLSETITGLDAAVSGLRAQAASRRADLESRQAALDDRKSQRSRLNQRVQEAQQSVYDVRSQKDAALNAASLAQIKRTGLEDRLSSSRDNLGELEMQIREVAAQVDSGAQDKQLQLGLLGSSDAVFQQRARELAIAEGELSRLEQELQQARFHLLQFESTTARLRAECSGYEVEQKTSVHRHDLLAHELAAVRSQQVGGSEAVTELNARVETVVAEKARAQTAAAAAQQAIADLTREFREAQRKLQDADRQLTQRGARLKLLQQLQERWEGFGEGAKAVLHGRLEGALGGTKAAPLLQGLTVKPEFGRAVEALLGSAAEAISVSDSATAQRILAQLESEQIGSAVLRIPGGSGGARSSQNLPAGVVPAIGTVEEADPSHPALGIFNECYVADDLGAFLSFWQANPEFGFLAVATRKGEIVDRRGLISGGYQNARKQAQSIVQRDIELRETARLMVDEQKTHDDQKAQIEVLAARLAAAEQALEQHRAAVMSATQSVAAAQAEQRTSQKALDEVNVRLQRMGNELASLDAACLEAKARWEKGQAGLAEADSATVAQREKLVKLETRLTEIRTERDVKRESLAQARLELAEHRQKVEVLDRGLGEMEKRRQQLGEVLVQRQQEIEVWTEQVSELGRESEAQKERASRMDETLGRAQEQVESIRRELLGIEQAIGAAESAQAGVRAESDAAQGELSAQEIKLAESRQRAQFLAEDAQREFQSEVAALDWKQLLWQADGEPEGLKLLDLDEAEEVATATSEAVGLRTEVGGQGSEDSGQKPGEPKRKRKAKARGEPTAADFEAMEIIDWAAVKTECDALRQRMNSMGAVNLVAIEEYSDLKQRHDFLASQCNDLTTARVELLKVIDEINQTSLKQFQVTFEQITKNFEYTFQCLFGGGRATLELIQAEDILESGIEIVAQPPGTKLKSISLLSGGQKTLTAVALLFALYMVKPSPFCLLDELDAPLDESNIGRFTDLLKKFVSESQFIIITHNKRTVAAADAIYGVTMEERGVSKTISMRFNHERGEAETPAPNIAESVVSAAAVGAPA